MRFATILLLTLLLVASLSGCGPSPEESGSDKPSAEKPAEAPSETPEADPYAPIEISGAGEKAAVEKLPALLEAAREMRDEKVMGAFPDVAGKNPVLTAYLVKAQAGDKIALFEVHADGKAYGLYAYPQKFDASKVNPAPADFDSTKLKAPVGEGEQNAVKAVTPLAEEVFGQPAQVGMKGYRFVWPEDKVNGQPYMLEVDVDGNIISTN